MKKTNEKKNITPKWTINNLLNKYPETADILIKYGFHCIGCALADMETIEQGGKVHGLTKKEIEKLVEELNKNVS